MERWDKILIILGRMSCGRRQHTTYLRSRLFSESSSSSSPSSISRSDFSVSVASEAFLCCESSFCYRQSSRRCKASSSAWRLSPWLRVSFPAIDISICYGSWFKRFSSLDLLDRLEGILAVTYFFMANLLPSVMRPPSDCAEALSEPWARGSMVAVFSLS